MKKIIFLVFVSLFFSLVSLRVDAATLYRISYSVQPPQPSVAADHTITFLAPNVISSGSIVLNLKNCVSSMGSIDFASIDLIYKANGTNATVNANVAASPGDGIWGVAIDTINKKITLNYPTSNGTAVAARQIVTILIGTNASGGTAQLVNATSAGSRMGSIVVGTNIGTFAVSLNTNPALSASGSPTQTSQTQSTQSAPAALLPVAPPPAPAPSTPAPSTPTPPAPVPPPPAIDEQPSLAPVAQSKIEEVKTPPVPPKLVHFGGGGPANISVGGVDVSFDPKSKLSKQAQGYILLKEKISQVLESVSHIQTDSKSFTNSLDGLTVLEKTLQDTKIAASSQDVKMILDNANLYITQARNTLFPSQQELIDIRKNSAKFSQELLALKLNIDSSQKIKNTYSELTDSIKKLNQIFASISSVDIQKGDPLLASSKNAFKQMQGDIQMNNEYTKTLKSIFEDLKKEESISTKKDIQINMQQVVSSLEQVSQDERALSQLYQKIPEKIQYVSDDTKITLEQVIQKGIKISQELNAIQDKNKVIINVLQEIKKASSQDSIAQKKITNTLQSLNQASDFFDTAEKNNNSTIEKNQKLISLFTVSSSDVLQAREIVSTIQTLFDTMKSDVSGATLFNEKRVVIIQEGVQRVKGNVVPQGPKILLFKNSFQKINDLISQAIQVDSPEVLDYLAFQKKLPSVNTKETVDSQLSAEIPHFKVDSVAFSQLSQRVGEEITLQRPVGKRPVGKAFVITASVQQKGGETSLKNTETKEKNYFLGSLVKSIKKYIHPPFAYAQEALTQINQKTDKNNTSSSINGVEVPPYQDIIPLVYFDPPLDMTFHYTKDDIAIVQEETIKLYSWDILNEKWIQEQATVHPQDKTVTVSLSHLSIFGLFGEPLPGTENIKESQEQSPSNLSEAPVSELDLGLKELATDKALLVKNKKFYSTPNKDLYICIPGKLFKKAVKYIVLSIEKNTFPLQYEKEKDCYGAIVKTPAKKGKQAVKIRVIYADDEVQVITFEIEITDEFQSHLLSTLGPFLDGILAANTQVRKTIETTQPALQTAAIATTPVVMAANSTIFSNTLHWFHYLNHFFSWLFSFFGFRKKRRRSWGMIYDAAAKTPIDLAIVRLFDAQTKKLIETQVTDKNGRFSFLVSPGEFTITVIKPPFVFPSSIVSGISDGEYLNIYHGGGITIHSEQDAISISIPLDPPSREALHGSGLFKDAHSFLLHHSLGILGLSFFVSALLIFYTPHALNIILFVANALFVCGQWFLFSRKEKPWGVVFDSVTAQPIPLAAIAIIDATEKKLVKTRLTDYFGRFNFFAPAGRYIISVSKDLYLFPPTKQVENMKYKNIYTGGEVIIKKAAGFARVNIPLEKQEQKPIQELPTLPQSEKMSETPISLEDIEKISVQSNPSIPQIHTSLQEQPSPSSPLEISQSQESQKEPNESDPEKVG